MYEGWLRRHREGPTIERNVEIIRQWQILMDLATSADCTISSLARKYRKNERTIRRDLAALETAGFALYPERVDTHNCWRLADRPLKRITETSFTLPELCAFYLNRAQLAASGGTPIDADVRSAIAKVGKALGPQMKTYLDKLTSVLAWKPAPAQRAVLKEQPATVERLVKATIEHRRLEMDYDSFASRKVKAYSVEPYRLTFGNGGLYLLAYVPAYGQMRTFAVQRIRKLSVSEKTFDPVQDVSSVPYGNSLGMYSGGTPERLEIEFGSAIAPYIEEREWHPSQAIERRPDGSIVLAMKVAIDLPLRSWILGFGHQARVLRPSKLAETILEELEEAREQYAPHLQFELAPAIYDSRQPGLPFQHTRGERSSRASTSHRGAGASRHGRKHLSRS